MTLAMALDEDYHVHSTFSDGASSVAENLRAAQRRGLRRLCLTDHVRRDTAWVAEFVAAVRALRAGSDLEILAGVEAKILDQAGQLDLPAGLDGIDLILVADHQFPGADGPVLPADLAVAIARGTFSGEQVISGLVEATASALAGTRGRRALIAHLFSVLPKLGLSESAVPEHELGLLAGRARDTGALLEVNEKWACPSARTVSAFVAASVPVVASSDSHDCRDVGVYRTVRQTLGAVAAGSAA